MIRLELSETKEFMKKFLMEEVFDDYLLIEGSVMTASSYILDGHLQKEYFSSEEWGDSQIRPYDFVTWSERKPVVLAMIKGKKAPAYMKLSLQLKPEKAAEIFGEKANLLAGHGGVVSGLVCTMKYEKGIVSLTSGVAYTTFSLDKEAEQIWDKQLQLFLEKNEMKFKVQ